MPSSTTIIKSLLTPVILPGAFMTAMGLGLLPLDEKMMATAAPFIDPLGIPFRPFTCVLGPLKIMGALALWGIGPLPEWFARSGLAISALCGAYGHISVGDSALPPMMYAGMIAALYIVELTAKGKKE